jgi:hypothetical protein
MPTTYRMSFMMNKVYVFVCREEATVVAKTNLLPAVTYGYLVTCAGIASGSKIELTLAW